MKKAKKVERTLYAVEIDMGGIPVRQALPTKRVDQIDPFLLLHHGSFPVEKGGNPLHMGVGPHPHTGFAPLSIVLGGEVHHRDSLGNTSIIGEGGIQWVHAGRGIIHSERPSPALAQKGGVMEVIQLWINLPAANKKDSPAYISATADELPVISPAEGVRMHLITGTYGGKNGPVQAVSPMLIARVEFVAGAEASLEIPENFNAALYVTRGSGSIGGHGLASHHELYQLSLDGGYIHFKAAEESQLILLAGAPLDEPVSHYGPFVMNTQTEIMEAMRDYQMGKMGVLIEE